MANPSETRVCRLHELVVRDANGLSRAFRYGEVVEITPELAESLGVHLEAFEPYAYADGGPAPAGFVHTVVLEDTDVSNAVIRPIVEPSSDPATPATEE